MWKEEEEEKKARKVRLRIGGEKKYFRKAAVEPKELNLSLLPVESPKKQKCSVRRELPKKKRRTRISES